MGSLPDRTPWRRILLNKIMAYTQKAGKLGQRGRQTVFGFRKQSTANPELSLAMDSEINAEASVGQSSLLTKLRNHRLLQRRHAFRRGGGYHSSIALHALKKADRRQKP